MPQPPTDSGRATKPSRRPGSSMWLLTEVMEHTLDAGYAEAAARRGEVGGSRLPRTARAKVGLGVGLVLVALVITVGGVRAHHTAPKQADERAKLRDRIEKATASADAKKKTVERLRSQVDRAQRDALRRDPPTARPSKRVKALAGEEAVSGPGLLLTVTDASSGEGKGSDDPRQRESFGDTGRVRDRDLQRIVNGLWQAGAEAVSIDGQRMTAVTAIRAAGDAVLVDNRPLSPPYHVAAVGEGGRQLATKFRRTADGLYLKALQDEYGIGASIRLEQKVRVPSGPGAALRHVSPWPAASPTPTASSERGSGSRAGPSSASR